MCFVAKNISLQSLHVYILIGSFFHHFVPINFYFGPTSNDRYAQFMVTLHGELKSAGFGGDTFHPDRTFEEILNDSLIGFFGFCQVGIRQSQETWHASVTKISTFRKLFCMELIS